MSQTFSTRDRDLSRGQLYSSRVTSVTTQPAVRPVALAVGAPAAPPAPAPAVVEAPVSPPVALPEQSFTFLLSTQGIVPAPPTGAQATGTVTLKGRPGSACSVAATLNGLSPHRDPSIRPALWLIHDLTVPEDLVPADLTALPRGAGLTGNQPGAVFTIDGNPATYGKASNTLSVAVTPGQFVQTGKDSWSLSGELDRGNNQAFHPLAVLGPSALGNIDVALPSGTVARILTDLFMRPATVHPELNLRSHYAQRLAAVVRNVMNDPGAVAYLAPDRFTRAAVTLEGIVRGTPRLMPTREACCLMANFRG
ncbi:MAG TPA: hypothetical protein VNT75_20455 [Symbiobacteriaceae bacterium]|nr:hypothetical protein [Symbiobacteriaceae bacterium]